TTFFLKHEIDTGDMIMQRSIAIEEDENVGSVHDRLMSIGAEAVVTTVNDIINGTLHTRPQPEGEFIPAPKIFKETCRIDWNKSAREIHNHVRGLSPYPAAWTRMVTVEGNETDLKIFTTSLNGIPQLPPLAPGQTYIEKGHLYVGTSSEPVEILELQPAGKKRMEAGAFILGYHPTDLV
ncbi:MAG: methionyl-tRNA formyltransferase, partial [Muribaculaceae bacterium]|nr:methionyl-tRNA formyltransferase [Muribaculaceae bacterium]